jgi:two-component system, OmpR family, alkaline phosphatase synthesis response regulator PhoP
MSRRVLLCDDDVHILRAAEFKLKRAGYDVRTAGDGQEGWELIEREVPDVVVTDCQMPRLDGFGLLRRIRQNPETESLPVMMLTAKGFEIDESEAASEYDVHEVIAKPFSPRELLQKVDALLAGQPAAVE